ncbi:MAG: hypothetical protein ACE15F_25140 [bacterium]
MTAISRAMNQELFIILHPIDQANNGIIEWIYIIKNIKSTPKINKIMFYIMSIFINKINNDASS